MSIYEFNQNETNLDILNKYLKIYDDFLFRLAEDDFNSDPQLENIVKNYDQKLINANKPEQAVISKSQYANTDYKPSPKDMDLAALLKYFVYFDKDGYGGRLMKKYSITADGMKRLSGLRDLRNKGTGHQTRSAEESYNNEELLDDLRSSRHIFRYMRTPYNAEFEEKVNEFISSVEERLSLINLGVSTKNEDISFSEDDFQLLTSVVDIYSKMEDFSDSYKSSLEEIEIKCGCKIETIESMQISDLILRAEEEDAEAEYVLAKLLLWGNAPENLQDILDDNRLSSYRFLVSLEKEGNKVLGVQYLKKAANHGFIVAQLIVGECHIRNLIPEVTDIIDYEKAIDYLHIVAENGMEEVTCTMAQLYIKLDRFDKADLWFRESIKKEFSAAYWGYYIYKLIRQKDKNHLDKAIKALSLGYKLPIEELMLRCCLSEEVEIIKIAYELLYICTLKEEKTWRTELWYPCVIYSLLISGNANMILNSTYETKSLVELTDDAIMRLKGIGNKNRKIDYGFRCYLLYLYYRNEPGMMRRDKQLYTQYYDEAKLYLPKEWFELAEKGKESQLIIRFWEEKYKYYRSDFIFTHEYQKPEEWNVSVNINYCKCQAARNGEKQYLPNLLQNAYTGKRYEEFCKYMDESVTDEDILFAAYNVFSEPEFYDEQKAEEYLNKAADKENLAANEILAERTGDLKYYEKLAQKGMIEAQLKLAYAYFNGNSIAKNLNLAKKWFEKAEGRGSLEARFMLGKCYWNGWGTESIPEVAIFLLEDVYNRGNIEAEVLLAQIYAESEDIENLEKEIVLYKVLLKEHPDRAKNIEILYKKAKDKLRKKYKVLEKKAEEPEDFAKIGFQILAYLDAKDEHHGISLIKKSGLPYYMGMVQKRTDSIIQNGKKAAKYFEQAAKQNDPRAQFEIGEMYQKGIGVKADPYMAYAWYKAAAEQGNKDAMFQLAECLYNGIGIQQDVTKAIWWYEKSAKMEGNTDDASAKEGNAQAAYKLALYLGYENPLRALIWCWEAMRQRVDGAEDKFEQLLEIVKANMDQYTKIEQEMVQSMIRVKYNYDVDAMFIIAELFRRSNNFPDLYYPYWIEEAAMKGNYSAQNLLSIIFECKEKHEIEIFLTRKVAEEDKWNGCYNMVIIHTSTRPDYQKAFYYAKKGAELGSEGCQLKCGLFYKEGRAVARDDRKAFYWFQKAAEPRWQWKDWITADEKEEVINEKAQYELGLLYMTGRGTDKNQSKALQYFAEAAQKGHTKAQYELAECYYYAKGVAKDEKKAFAWYKKAAEAGHADAQLQAGYMCEMGLGTIKNNNQAFAWYQKSAFQGNAIAQCNLGLCYEVGRGIAVNYQMAYDWYYKAAGNDNSRARYRLGLLYYNGTGVEKSYANALYYFENAYQKGYREDNIEFKIAYSNDMLEKYKDAVIWYEKAIEKNPNDAASLNNLANLYMDGLGVTEDFHKAITYYKKSASLGNKTARGNLEKYHIYKY